MIVPVSGLVLMPQGVGTEPVPLIDTYLHPVFSLPISTAMCPWRNAALLSKIKMMSVLFELPAMASINNISVVVIRFISVFSANLRLWRLNCNFLADFQSHCWDSAFFLAF